MKNNAFRIVSGTDKCIDYVKRLAGRMCAIFLIVMWFGQGSLNGAEPITVYFYSTETNINNFKSLKMEFDNYLSKFGPYQFQPFSDKDAFEQHIHDIKKHLLFLSSWHYTNIYAKYGLKPCLVGMRDGRNYQKRILVTGLRVKDINAALNGPVASSSNTAYTKSILAEMTQDPAKAESARVLKVPKDVDALMSVGFEMAKSALTTENALENLKKLDPVLFKKLKILAEGKESLLLVMASADKDAEEAEKIIEIIRKMPEDPVGMNIIKMLDLDGWKPVDPSDKSKLEG